MIPLYKPYVPDLPELEAILHSGKLTYGKYTCAFEGELRSLLHSPYIFAVDSFFSALYITLMTFGLTADDEVIVSPMACLNSTQPLVVRGLRVVWADVDPDTGTLCPDCVRKVVSAKTKAIFHNHFCGYPGHIDEISSIGREYGIPVIDDAIEAFGSMYHGDMLGNSGADATIFSFNPVRFLNTVDGGAVSFADKKHYERALLIRDCGIDRSRFRDRMQEINPECDISIPGMSCMMSEVNGYIGLCQIKEVQNLLEAHRKQAVRWDEYFGEIKDITPIHRPGCLPNYWVYGVLTKDKPAFLKHFRECGYYASGVHVNNSVYSVFGTNEANLPNTEKFNSAFLALPCGWWMEKAQRL